MSLAVLFPATVAFAQAVSFSPATNFLTQGAHATSVAIADLNGDGKPDLAVANAFSNNVSILLGTCTGGFGAATTFPVGSRPMSVAIADLNGDGKPDLAVANYDGGDVAILFGTGTGSFGVATIFPASIRAFSLAIGDFNGDGKPDLAVSNFFNDNVSILLGTGSGAFGPATSFAVGGRSFSVAVSDLNGDGKPDLALANIDGDSVSILLGTGSGGFGATTNFAVGTDPIYLAIGDLNGDGKPDVAVANDGSNNVSILLGTGSGGFLPATNFPAGLIPASLAIADLNVDGKPDLVVVTRNDAVSILLGTGTGAFGAATDFAVGTHPYFVAISDLNGDGKPDVAVTNRAANTVSILLNTSLSQNHPAVAKAGQTVEATSPSGASVTLDGSGSFDPDSDPLTYNWTGPFGAVSGVSPTVTLKLGTHIVTLTVNDGQATATDTIHITVRDTTPPDTINNSAVDGNGATMASGGSTLSQSIKFTFGGTDEVGVAGFQCSRDMAPYASCSSPVDYSALAIGSYIFRVRALDAAGNVDASPASFNWTVVTPAQAIQNLMITIANMGLPGGVTNSLRAPLGQASNLLNDNNPKNDNLACGKLNDFIKEVYARVKNGKLTPAQASQFLQAANAIRAAGLNC